MACVRYIRRRLPAALPRESVSLAAPRPRAALRGTRMDVEVTHEVVLGPESSVVVRIGRAATAKELQSALTRQVRLPKRDARAACRRVLRLHGCCWYVRRACERW